MPDLLVCSGSMNQFTAIYSGSGELINHIKYYDGFMGQRVGAISCLAFHPHWVCVSPRPGHGGGGGRAGGATARPRPTPQAAGLLLLPCVQERHEIRSCQVPGSPRVVTPTLPPKAAPDSPVRQGVVGYTDMRQPPSSSHLWPLS